MVSGLSGNSIRLVLNALKKLYNLPGYAFIIAKTFNGTFNW